MEVYTVNLWDVDTRTKRRTLRTDHGHFHGLSAVAWSPDGRFIAASGRNGSDGRVVVWTSAGAPWAELPNHGGTVWSLAFSADSRTLAAGDAEQRAVRLWDVQTGQQQSRLQAFPGAVFGLAFSTDGRTLSAGGTDGQNGVLVQWECPVAE